LVKNKLGQDVEVNWSQPRVILIAQGFSRYVLAAVQQVKNVELKSYHYYTPDILQVEDLHTPAGVNASVRIVREQTEGGIVEDVEEMDLQHHLDTTSPEMQERFNQIRAMVLELPSVVEKDNQLSGITYRTTKSFCRFEFRPTWIQLLVRDPEYKIDSEKLVRDVTTHKWGYKGMVRFDEKSDIEQIFALVKASYESTL
jgi:predicted transport protein